MTYRRAVAYAFKAALIGASGLCAALGATSASQAQTPPQIATVPANSNPPVPAGLKVTCTPNPNTGAPSPTCPVIQYGGVTTWAYSFIDNRVSYGIVSYDANGQVLKNVTRDGARYVYKMTVDPGAKTVSVWGQSDAKVDIAWSDLPTSTPVYAWVAAASPPANVVKGANMAQAPVCRGLGQYDRPWAGWWDGSACNGSYGGGIRPATKNIQFLTLVSGTVSWVPGQSDRYNQVGPLPPGSINAGKTYSGYDQVLCSYGGFIGWVYSNTCEQSGTHQGGIGPFVLTGAVQ
jgi:hypothetical protein